MSDACPEGVAADARPVVLVVDDSTLLRRTYETLFSGTRELKEYRLHSVPSAEDALAFLGRLRRGERRPSLIILDVHLPRMGGYELLAVLREDIRWKPIPVLMSTADDGRQAADKALSSGAAGFLSKPLQSKTLPAKIAAAVSSPAAGTTPVSGA